MDLKTYFNDVQKCEKELNEKFPDRIVHVTSIYHRERNSTAGSTLSATPANAARVITDGTHRLSTDDEIQGFLNRQEEDRAKSIKMEQNRNKQFIVMVDPNATGDAALRQGAGERLGKAVVEKLRDPKLVPEGTPKA